ncbi:MAG: alditol oxidase [Solirubrobacteraceae bacterium]
MTEVNWAGTHAYRATRIHRPSTVAEVQEIVARAPRVRVLGSRHSFSDVGDSDELVTLEGLPADLAVDRERMTVSVAAGVKYGELAEALNAEGLALHNLASLPHISVAGAIATATHGSGNGNGNLATAVAGLELVTSEGELLAASRGDPDFDGLVVGLGALGAVTRVVLDVEPAYEIRQRVFERLTWDALFEHYDTIAASGYSVSVFTRWGQDVEQVWIKSRVTEAPEEVRDELFGAVAATVDRHPIIGLDPVNCTPQLGVPGLWSDRLPHFRMGFTPSKGDEIQSEYFVARRHAVAAIEAMSGLGDRLEPLLLVSEIRTMAADRLWMSAQCGQDTAAFHFTWKREPGAVLRALADVEAVLRPFAARPHWGKVFVARAADVAPLYERLPDFVALMDRLDPRGAFRNAWLEERVLGA